jgi:hypothetical protein
VKPRVAFAAFTILVYFLGVALTSRLGPFETRPVLDGLAPPPAYRWVEPPPDLADANKKPFGGIFSLKFTHGRSEAGAFTIRDSQLSMILDPGVLPANGDATTARISITPLGASSVQPPSGYQVDGNVYRIAIAAEPSGEAITSFKAPQRVIVVYPADKSFVKPQHLIALSGNGKTWSRVKTQDSTVQQQASGLIRSPGLVAVVTPLKSKSSSSPVPVYAIVGLAVLAVLGLSAWWIYRSRGPHR